MKIIYIILLIIMISRPIYAIFFTEKSIYLFKKDISYEPTRYDLRMHRVLGIVILLVMVIMWALAFQSYYVSK